MNRDSPFSVGIACTWLSLSHSEWKLIGGRIYSRNLLRRLYIHDFKVNTVLHLFGKIF